MNKVEIINNAIKAGRIITVPIWEGVYTPASKFQVVEAVRERRLKVQLLNSGKGGWTKYITVGPEEWESVFLQATRSRR